MVIDSQKDKTAWAILRRRVEIGSSGLSWFNRNYCKKNIENCMLIY